MYFKAPAIALLAVTVAIAPAGRLGADTGSFLAGAAIGGLVGHLATKDAQKKRTSKSGTTYRPRLPSTQEGRQIQTSLNYFGFNAGSVDGQLGRKSRAAISQYQAYLGYPASGQLTPFERDFLIGAYNRAITGGHLTAQQVAVNPEGTRGLLRVYMAELANPTPVVPQPVPGTVPQQQVVLVQPSPNVAAAPSLSTVPPQLPNVPDPNYATIAVIDREDQPQQIANPSAGTSLPNFEIGNAPERSLNAHCNTVSLLTNTNGGFTTQASMTDPGVVLNEQFCLARTYAIGQSEAKAAQVRNFSAQQIDQQCAGLGNAMTTYVSELSTETRDTVVRDATLFVVNSGMDPNQLIGAGEICLGVGYRKDDMPVALGSAVLLVALGQSAYGELVGHHLAQGFGTSEKSDLAAAWFDAAFSAIDGGQAAIFAPGQPERIPLLRAATSQSFGFNATTASSPTGLPTFSFSD